MRQVTASCLAARLSLGRTDVERSSILQGFTGRCRAAGLDLAQPFSLATFHAASEPEHHLPCFGREDALAIVVGNTRALWPRFLEALRRERELLALPHPLDHYVVRSLTDALAGVPLRHEIHWAHHREPAIAIQRIAHAASLAELGPAHLCVHPEHGPWLALRAVVVFDVDAVEMGISSDGGAPSPSHCRGCAAPCVAALERALAGTPSATGANPWLGVRDACPVGRASRYDDDQIRYHYDKDASLLVRLAAK